MRTHCLTLQMINIIRIKKNYPPKNLNNKTHNTLLDIALMYLNMWQINTVLRDILSQLITKVNVNLQNDQDNTVLGMAFYGMQYLK